MLAIWLIALLASLPLMLFAYLGQYSRMMGDDYARFATAVKLGGRVNFLHWWNSWDGSFAGILFHDVIAPLGAPNIPRFFPSAVIALWWLGLSWLIWLALSAMRLRRHRILISFALASLTTGAAVNAFYAWESIYWYTACVDNTLPVGGLLLIFAFIFMFARGQRSRRSIASAAAAVMLSCFVIGGFSEMYVVFQIVYLSLLLSGIVAYDQGSRRVTRLGLVAAGCFGSVCALLLQLSAPGVAYRIGSASTERSLQPIRSPAELVIVGIETSFEYVGQRGGIAGFALMLAAGLALALMLRRAQESTLSGPVLTLARAPLALVLLIQGGYSPILWRGFSENATLGGAISLADVSALASVTLSSGASLLLLLRRRQIEVWLARIDSGPACFSAGILCYALLLMAIAQLPSAAGAISSYLFVTALAWLGILLALLLSGEDEARARRIGRTAAWSMAVAVVAIAVPVLAGLFFNGVVYSRVMPSTALIQVLTGLLWGLCIGCQLARALQLTRAGLAWLKLFRAASVIAAAGLALGIVVNQALLAPKFATYAREWDARQERVIQLKEKGELQIEVAPFSFDMTAFIAASGQTIGGSAAYFYDVESIQVVDS